jgi:hypothetical protein
MTLPPPDPIAYHEASSGEQEIIEALYAFRAGAWRHTGQHVVVLSREAYDALWADSHKSSRVEYIDLTPGVYEISQDTADPHDSYGACPYTHISKIDDGVRLLDAARQIRQALGDAGREGLS